LTEILYGRKVARAIRREVKEQIMLLEKPPTLAIILVGEDDASQIYVKMKQRACRKVGIRSLDIKLPRNTSQDIIAEKIQELNQNPDVTGIIVQLPLPSSINTNTVLETIIPYKDVDGLHPLNQGRLLTGGALIPSTPLAVLRILEFYEIPVAGKHAVIINRSRLVGRPLAQLLLNRDATVTVCHSKTQDLSEVTRQADLLISAVGRRPSFTITGDMIKAGATLIDVGLNRVDGKVVGDIDATSVEGRASHLTPVPKGVGPVTVATVLHNVLTANKLQSD
jgi:methylenetetrahydrofolate dehydrogenase (NADP+)/methenyltetrahydrofolate cyclohydrolase